MYTKKKTKGSLLGYCNCMNRRGFFYIYTIRIKNLNNFFDLNFYQPYNIRIHTLSGVFTTFFSIFF